MEDPIAFFLTVATYGTWLPGDARGWVEYHSGWQLSRPQLEIESRARMSEDACILSFSDRVNVEEQLVETCSHRGWILHTKNCRSNHMHVVVCAIDTSPAKVRQDLKAWCTRRLKATSQSSRANWWAERGSVRWVFTEEELERVIEYVNDSQDRKHLDTQSEPDA